jgi:thiosulfate/3-mercaptopyruvate sulfurtransferase
MTSTLPDPMPPIVDAAQLLAWLAGGHDIALLDCRFELSDPAAGEQAYAAGHPPGAIYAHLERDLSAAKNAGPQDPAFRGRHPLPDRAAFAAVAGRAWGIGPATAVVCFDAHGAPYASRTWWTLRWLGHERVAVLDGGLDAWKAAGGAITTKVVARAPLAPYPMSARPSMPTIDADELMRTLDRRRIVDARGADRFRGENEVLDPVAGHIPGATSRPFKDNLDATGRFKPADVLEREWQALLGDADPARIVQQCGSGVTACQNLLVLMHAGWPATALYAGSWSEWSADPARPRALGS